MTATHDAEGATPDRNPDEIPYVNMTVWGVPLADVLPVVAALEALHVNLAGVTLSSAFGPGAARTLLGIAHEMSPFGKEVAP